MLRLSCNDDDDGGDVDDKDDGDDDEDVFRSVIVSEQSGVPNDLVFTVYRQRK